MADIPKVGDSSSSFDDIDFSDGSNSIESEKASETTGTSSCAPNALKDELGEGLDKARESFSERFTPGQADHVCIDDSGTYFFDHVNRGYTSASIFAESPKQLNLEPVVVDFSAPANSKTEKLSLIESIVFMDTALTDADLNIREAESQLLETKKRIQDYEEYKNAHGNYLQSLLYTFLGSMLSFGVMTTSAMWGAQALAINIGMLGKLVELNARDLEIKNLKEKFNLCENVNSDVSRDDPSLNAQIARVGLAGTGISIAGYLGIMGISKLAENDSISSDETRILPENYNSGETEGNSETDKFDAMMGMSVEDLQSMYEVRIKSYLAKQAKAKVLKSKLMDAHLEYMALTAEDIKKNSEQIIEDVESDELKTMIEEISSSENIVQDVVEGTLSYKILDTDIGHLLALGAGFGVGTHVVSGYMRNYLTPKSIQTGMKTLETAGKTDANRIVAEMLRANQLIECEEDAGAEELRNANNELLKEIVDKAKRDSGEQSLVQESNLNYDLTQEWATFDTVARAQDVLEDLAIRNSNNSFYRWKSDIDNFIKENMSSWGFGSIDAEHAEYIRGQLDTIEFYMKNFSANGSQGSLRQMAFRMNSLMGYLRNFSDDLNWDGRVQIYPNGAIEFIEIYDVTPNDANHGLWYSPKYIESLLQTAHDLGPSSADLLLNQWCDEVLLFLTEQGTLTNAILGSFGFDSSSITPGTLWFEDELGKIIEAVSQVRSQIAAYVNAPSTGGIDNVMTSMGNVMQNLYDATDGATSVNFVEGGPAMILAAVGILAGGYAAFSLAGGGAAVGGTAIATGETSTGVTLTAYAGGTYQAGGSALVAGEGLKTAAGVGGAVILAGGSSVAVAAEPESDTTESWSIYNTYSDMEEFYYDDGLDYCEE